MTDLASAVNAVRQAKPGSEVVFRIRRGDMESDVKVQVDAFPFGFLIQLD